MSFLSRLFGSAKPTRDVEAELKRLETEAESAAPGYVGTAYNRAGDLALKGGESDRALKYYGRAIDAFLQDAQREAARGVANKIIRVRPSAVRTLCTLTWLDLAARHQATALLHLRDYVRAAREAGQHARAATQIFEMGRISADTEFVDAVADALDSLDFPTRADEVRGWANDGSPGAISDPLDLGQACLDAAVQSNDRDQVLLLDVAPIEGEGEADEPDGPVVDDSGEAPRVETTLTDEARSDEARSDEARSDEAGSDDAGSDDAGSDEGEGGSEEGEMDPPADENVPNDGARVEDAPVEDAPVEDAPEIHAEAGDTAEAEDTAEDGAVEDRAAEAADEPVAEVAAVATVAGETAEARTTSAGGKKKKKGKKGKKGRKSRKKKKK